MAADLKLRYPTLSIVLIQQQAKLLPGFPTRASQLVEGELVRLGITIVKNQTVIDITEDLPVMNERTPALSFDTLNDAIDDSGVYSTSSEGERYHIITHGGLTFTSDHVIIANGPSPNTKVLERHFASYLDEKGFVNVRIVCHSREV